MKDNPKNNNPQKPFDLFRKAQEDIITISDHIESSKFPIETKFDSICRLVTESAEKMMKGWLSANVENIGYLGTHDLEKLHEIIIKYDNKFNEIEDICTKLNNYTTAFRYESPFKIEEHEVKECLQFLKYIYDFQLIRDTRENVNREHNFIILPDDINTLFGEFGSEIADND